MQNVIESITDSNYQNTPLGRAMECEKNNWIAENNGMFDLIYGVSDETRLRNKQNDHNTVRSRHDAWWLT